MRKSGIGLIAVAAIAMAAPTVEATAASDAGPVASKSSSKKNRSRARSYLLGEWNSSGSGVSITVAFCRDGTYGFRVLKDNGGRPSDTTFDGSWRVTSAGKASARVRYTIEHFKSAYIDGSPGPDSFPGSPAVLAARATSRSTATFDGVPFSRGPGTCSSVTALLSAGA